MLSFVVTTTSDDGVGSLRQAILDANATAGLDEIHFNIPSNLGSTIAPTSPLPTITSPVIIDGYTQPGAIENTDPAGFDGTLLVELNGAGAGSSGHGLHVAGGGSTIRGLVINRFSGDGIRLESSDNVVEGNLIGTNASGTLGLGNGGHGVAVASTAAGTTIYVNDFEEAVGSEWSTTATSVTPIGQRHFLGELGSETATLTIPASSIPAGTAALTVDFDLFVIRTWDGNHTGGGSGPDHWRLSLGSGLTLIDTTFSNNVPNSAFAGQAYPGTSGTGQFEPLTGADEINTLGYTFGDPMDSVYKLDATFSYTGGDVILNFTGALTTPGPDESWGLDNVLVKAVAVPPSTTVVYDAEAQFSATDNPNAVWSHGWSAGLTTVLNLYNTPSVIQGSLDAWSDPAHVDGFGTPLISHNPTSSANGVHEPHTLNLHPGPAGEYSRLRWTAPAAGQYLVSAAFSGTDNASTDVHVLLNNASPTLFSGNVNGMGDSESFVSSELALAAGDWIDFAVGYGAGGHFFDTTRLEATIAAVPLVQASTGNIIGGTSPSARNMVAHNGGDGIDVAGQDSHAVFFGNLIFDNDGLGIDLQGGTEDVFGVTANDADDTDAGANGLQNFPVLAEAKSLAGATLVEGVLASAPNADYRIEFFANVAADASSHGEAERFLGWLDVSTDASGRADVVANLAVGVAEGERITATATDSAGNTSEFSPAAIVAEVQSADLDVTISDSPDPVIIGEPLTYRITVTNHGPADATGVAVTVTAPQSADFNSVTVPLGDVANGQSRSFQLSFTPRALGTFSAVASVVAAEEDPKQQNNSFTQITVIEPAMTLQFATAAYEVREGEEYAVLTVRRTGDLSQSASVEFTTLSGTAGERGIVAGLLRQDDFTTASGMLFFRPRSNVATIRVPIYDDSRIESNETFQVVLSNPSENAALGAITAATVTILDNDPSLSFTAGSSERRELSRGRILPIDIVLSNPVAQTVTVAYSVAGGTATPGQDFTPQSGVITFRPGETKQPVPLQIVSDTLFEGNETVILDLSNSENAFLGATTRHRLTIVDDDLAPPPADPGPNAATALVIDLATLPRQSYRQSISRTDVETFRVELGANEFLALDVDPAGLGGALPSSKLVILGEDGQTVLANIGASAEPETGRVTRNPAHLFQADADGGTYYIQLTTSAGGRGYGYTLDFHRIGVSEDVPSAERLNVPGAMYAWFDGVDTVGITGPTGYGFTLEGPWQHEVVRSGRTVLTSQTLTLAAGSRFTLRSPQGVELPLIANGPISIATNPQRWGNIVGVVSTPSIDFPVALAIAPVNDLLAEVVGSEFLAFGVLSGQWRISLGASAVHADGRNTNAPVNEMLAGIPYLRQKGPIKMSAALGSFILDYSVIATPIEWIFDPGDPMLYVKADQVGQIKEAALAVSPHGLLEFLPQDAPNPLVDAGITEFYGHVYATAKIPFKIGPLPMEVDAEVVVNVDADRDGQFLGGLRRMDDLFDVLKGDFSEIRDIVNDVQLGANGTLVMSLKAEKDSALPPNTYTMEAGRASVVLNGIEETIWVRAQQGGDVLSPDFLRRLNPSGSIVTEGLISWDGDFLLSTTTSYGAAGINFQYGITITNEGIFARVTGSARWNVTFDYGAGEVSGTATATIEADLAIEFDNNGDVQLSGSIGASGKLKFNGNTVFSGSIEASVRSKGFRFRFPRGVGHLDLSLFD